MNDLRRLRTARVICTVLASRRRWSSRSAPLGRRPEFAVPVDHLGDWLRDGDAARRVLAACSAGSRCSARGGCSAAPSSTSRPRQPGAGARCARCAGPRCPRCAGRSTPRARSRSSRRCVLAPAAPVPCASHPPSVRLVARRSRWRRHRRPPGRRATTTGGAVRPHRTAVPSPASVSRAHRRSRCPTRSSSRRATTSGSSRRASSRPRSGRARADVTDAEVAPYWVRVCDAQPRPTLRRAIPTSCSRANRGRCPPLS